MPIGTEVGLSPGNIVLCEAASSPCPQMGYSPQFPTNVYWRQMAALMKMPLGMDVGLDQGTSS